MESRELKAVRLMWTKELQTALSARQKLDARILGIQQILKGLEAVEQSDTDAIEIPSPGTKITPPAPPPGLREEMRKMGLTDAIRKILADSGLAFLPTQVRDRLEMFDYPLQDSNPLAAIHATLKRLTANGEIKAIEADDGKTAYRWITPVEKAFLLAGIGEAPTFNKLAAMAGLADKKKETK